MAALPQAPTLFENADWTLTAGGLAHKATGYFIEREQWTDRRADGLWTWPLHMAEKAWCAPDTFEEAFGRALETAAIVPDAAFAASFAEARGAAGPPGDERGPIRLGELVRFGRGRWPAGAASTAAVAARRAPGSIPSRTKRESSSPDTIDEPRNPAFERGLGALPLRLARA